jgi:hypothetical protein
MSTSLIHPPGQADLIPASEADSFCIKLEAKGEFTAARFFEKRPTDYKRAMALLARGYGVLATATEIGSVSKNTIRAIREREGQTIDLLREHLGSKAYALAEDTMEAASVLLEEIMADKKRRKKLTVGDVQRLLVSFGIATQNAQLMTGQATGRTVVETAAPAHDDYNKYIESLRSAAPMGLAGGSLGQKGGAQLLEVHAVPVQPAADAKDQAVASGRATAPDSQSEGKPTQPTETQ